VLPFIYSCEASAALFAKTGDGKWMHKRVSWIAEGDKMRALLQRVNSAEVSVGGEVVGAIGQGLLAFVAFARDDTPADGNWIARKILAIRLFEDDSGKMGRSVQDIGGGLLIVSQFTLYGEMRKGTRPDFGRSMAGPQAKEFYENWVARLRQMSALTIQEGRFAAQMAVKLTNDGPVTLMLDSRKTDTEE
jgi:D-tyrosyl-tRNA(Tyr) deacylase